MCLHVCVTVFDMCIHVSGRTGVCVDVSLYTCTNVHVSLCMHICLCVWAAIGCHLCKHTVPQEFHSVYGSEQTQRKEHGILAYSEYVHCV